MVIAMLIGGGTAMAQGNDYGEDLTKITTPSSNVSSLLKFTELPVNYSTGTPDISIPIYTINTGKLTLPVTLKYVASGIRVAENSGSVGLGWSLSAEGAIQQGIFGLEDDGTYRQYGLQWTNAALLPTSTDDYHLLESLNTGGLDGVPDVYTFSFPGNGGKFIYADSFRCLPQQNLAISTAYNGPDQSWTIVDQNGTQYFFTLTEYTHNRDASSSSFSRAWYLTKIRDANNVDSIVLEYENMKEGQAVGRSYSFTTFRPDGFPLSPYSIDMAPNDPPIPGTFSQISQTTTGWQLKRIIWNNGSLEYDIAWGDREDLGGDRVPRIKNLLLYGTDALLKRVIHFDQDYFVTPGNNEPYMGKRLRLQKVTFAPSLATLTSPDAYQYSFEYNETPLPGKLSNQIDHWGFYNGAIGNESRGLIPSFTKPGIHYYGADRNVNPFYAKAAMLTKVNYPTGGYAEFSWQSHAKVYPTQLLDSAIIYFDSTMYAEMIHTGHPVNGTWEDIITIPTLPTDMFGAGLSAKYTASGVGIGGGGNYPLLLTHASVQGKLYEYSSLNPMSSPVTRAQYDLTYNYNTNTANWAYSTNLTLYPGKSYKFFGHVLDEGWGVRQTLKVKWPKKVLNTYTPPTEFVGGLRIAKITLYDNFTDKSIIKKYGYPNCRAYSAPNYTEEIYKWYKLPTNDPNDCQYGKTQGLVVSSNSTHNFQAGPQAAYDTVREVIGEHGEGGYNVYTFTPFTEPAGEFPASWRFGRMLTKSVFTNANVEVQRTIYNNRTVLNPAQNFAGHTAKLITSYPCFNSGLIGVSDFAPLYRQRTYSFPCDWIYVDTIKTYDLVAGTSTIAVTDYDNPNHRQPTRSTTYNSDGSRRTTFIKYPTDYALSSAPIGDAAFISQLQQKHMHSIPIEQYTQLWLPGSGSPLTIAASYKQFGNLVAPQPGLLAMKRSYKLELSEGITDFQPATISGNSISKDNRYKEKAYAAEYDTRANLVSLSLPGSQGEQYIYGYANAFPIAVVRNNDNSRKAGFTSFEEGATGNWTYNEGAVVNSASQSLTGRRFLDLSLGSPSFYFRPADNSDPSPHPIPPPAAYIVSYWLKGGTAVVSGSSPGSTGISANGWTYYEHLIPSPNGPVTINGTGQLDELRIYPVGSVMESFTYDPLNGITSRDDGAGSIIRYDYDNMGRLKTEKDIRGNTIKAYEYKYMGNL